MNLRKKLVMAGSIAMSLTVGGVAYAFWTGTGTGTGSAKTGSAPVVDVFQIDAPLTGLVPGGSPQRLDLNLLNHGPANAKVNRVVVTVDPFEAQANVDKPKCTEADFSVTNAVIVNSDLAPGEHPLPGGSSGTGATIVMNNSSTNQDNCQNVTVALRFTPTYVP